MKWNKLGRIFNIKKTELKNTYAQCPVVEDLNTRWRVYYASRCKENKSRIFYFDIDPENPQQILNAPDEPLFELGKAGTFDCDGIMPSCVINDKFYLVGWNSYSNPPYRLSIGVAVKEGHNWKKLEGPIMDRFVGDPYSCTSPFVMQEDNTYKMWYSSISEWKEIKGKMECKYNIKYAISQDGIDWRRHNITCIDYDNFADAICWQNVWKDGFYKMIYCYRSADGFREDTNNSYRIGYAESKDGMKWIRKDSKVGIARSKNKKDWDHEMMAYPRIHKKFMFYNGNGFGKSGIGVAKLLT